MYLPDSINLPIEVEWARLDNPTQMHGGTLSDWNGEPRLDSEAQLSFLQDGVRSSAPPWIITTIAGQPTVMRASIRYESGVQFLAITEMRVGASDLDSNFVSVSAEFEYTSEVLKYRSEDGPMRSPSTSLDLPALSAADAMVLHYPGTGLAGTIELVSTSPVALETFEAHLRAFQDLITFATRRPSARLALVAVRASGQTVQIIGRTKVLPHGPVHLDHREFTLRLAGTNTEQIVERWWRGVVDLRPILQVFVGAIYQPGYIESDLLAAAAAMEHFSNLLHPVPPRSKLTAAQLEPIKTALETVASPDREQLELITRVFRNERATVGFYGRIEALVSTLDSNLRRGTHIDIGAWLVSFVKMRNFIAHEGSPPGAFDGELGPVRDATRSLLALLIAVHLGVPQAALQMAANALGARYGSVYRGGQIYP
ncbi:hypothetical protein E3N86_00850 [Cryobacterium sp. Hz7]|uniref:hypothetical protein n=1 Tax=Cryobacterium sp. Hz7 TaxID=1259166 RepID=UPI00106A5DF3|nr:hypothetical protein [Cryobacterium sp. Hz7]TFB66944.1 hypothetical protein E3N86_00850 [Cryobacterium sp. Hz7]